MPHFMIVSIPYINYLNLSWIKMSNFEEYGAFKALNYLHPTLSVFKDIYRGFRVIISSKAPLVKNFVSSVNRLGTMMTLFMRFQK